MKLIERFLGARVGAFLVALACLGVTAACGSDGEHSGPLGNPAQGGERGRAGAPNGGGAGKGGDTAVQPSGAPVVTIVSPAALADPDDGEVLGKAEAEVLCTVTADEGGRAVDTASVEIVLLGKDGKAIGEPPHVNTTANDGEYSATFVLTSVPSGPVTFRCSASDVGKPPILGSAEVGTFVDHGPAITIVRPKEHAAFPLGVVPFDFKVVAEPLSDADDGAAVDRVELEVASIPLEPAAGDAGEYSLRVDFTDTSLFPNPPSGSVPVIIRARNTRGTESVINYDFVIDGTGPVITVKNLSDRDVIGGQVVLRFTVVDELAGVDPDSIVVMLNDAPYPYDPVGQWTHIGDDYTFTFDSRNIEGSVAQVNIDILADDKAGNHGVESRLAYLDNQPPIADLDPANVREYRARGALCSSSFDPVGESASDLDVVPLFAKVRALVWDVTNAGPGQDILFYSTTNRSQVILYRQPTAATALLVDRSGDGVCDDLATSGTGPNGTDLAHQNLDAIAPTGNSAFGNRDLGVPPDPTGVCDVSDAVVNPPGLCQDEISDMFRVIHHGVARDEPVIYGVGVGQGKPCTGVSWELNNAKEGWLCLAVRAEDRVGNVGISPPLRLCYDDGVAPSPPCATGGEPPPSCTDGCTPPPRVDLGIIDE